MRCCVCRAMCGTEIAYAARPSEHGAHVVDYPPTRVSTRALFFAPGPRRRQTVLARAANILGSGCTAAQLPILRRVDWCNASQFPGTQAGRLVPLVPHMADS
eukprot:2544196-Rhodomonas_salina.1